MRRRTKIMLTIPVALLMVVGVLAGLGSVRSWHVTTVTRTTDADPDVMWSLWADVEERPRWDTGLDHIRADGPFEEGTTGTVKVAGQDPIAWEIVEVTPRRSYTDRFNSLLGTHTDWHHTLTPRADGRHDVTWRLEARGPLALVSLPVLKNIFGEEVPAAVDDFVELAESSSRD